jgi:hypothetical protein
MYLRFILPRINPDSGIEDGVFDLAYEIRRQGEISEHERAELGDLLRWFVDNLSVPTRFNRTKSKGHYRRTTKGISWFTSSARLHATKMHRMAAILRNQGHQVTMIKTSNPGYVVYEDDHQVIAEPFSDLRD